MFGILLSYRRDDAAAHARRLRDALEQRFGYENVLLGGQILGGGANEEAITRTVGAVDVVVAVIGPRWLGQDEYGNRRIDDPHDYVRVELAAALTRRRLVVPVLVAGATMPDEDALPDVLRPLCLRDRPVSIRDEAWDLDAEELLDRLEDMIVPPSLRTELQLRASLREAARAGVVPAFLVEPPSPAVGRDAYRVKTFHLPLGYDLRRQRRGEPLQVPRSSRLQRFMPSVLIGVGLFGLGLVVAKWLLGWFVAAEISEVPRDTVVCTLFAPPSAAPGQSLLVQAFAHLAEQAADAAAIATELDTEAQRRTFQSLLTAVPPGGRLDFELRMPGLEVDEPVASLVWHRRAEAVQFGVRIPPNTAPGAVIGTLNVSLNAAPVGHVKFKLVVGHDALKERSEPQGESARRYRTAFISYSSRDRDKVLARVQMLSVIGIRYFQDLLSLEPGERWARRIELGIDECDLFLLFWSNQSKSSEWVRKEVAYALARRGDDELAPPEIRPVIVEGPPIVEPWEELAHLHFNDRLLYFMSPPDK